MTTDKPEPMSAEEALEFMDSLASHVDERANGEARRTEQVEVVGHQAPNLSMYLS